MKKKKKKQKESAIDVLSHVLIPEAKVLGEAEKTKLLKKFGIEDTQLEENQIPKIESDDPLVVALKAVPGDVIRFRRDDGTGKYVTYRVVRE